MRCLEQWVCGQLLKQRPPLEGWVPDMVCFRRGHDKRRFWGGECLIVVKDDRATGPDVKVAGGTKTGSSNICGPRGVAPRERFPKPL